MSQFIKTYHQRSRSIDSGKHQIINCTSSRSYLIIYNAHNSNDHSVSARSAHFRTQTTNTAALQTYITINATSNAAMKAYIAAKVTYITAMQTYITAKVTYMSAMKTCISTMKTYNAPMPAYMDSMYVNMAANRAFGHPFSGFLRYENPLTYICRPQPHSNFNISATKLHPILINRIIHQKTQNNET